MWQVLVRLRFVDDLGSRSGPTHRLDPVLRARLGLVGLARRDDLPVGRHQVEPELPRRALLEHKLRGHVESSRYPFRGRTRLTPAGILASVTASPLGCLGPLWPLTGQRRRPAPASRPLNDVATPESGRADPCAHVWAVVDTSPERRRQFHDSAAATAHTCRRLVPPPMVDSVSRYRRRPVHPSHPQVAQRPRLGRESGRDLDACYGTMLPSSVGATRCPLKQRVQLLCSKLRRG